MVLRKINTYAKLLSSVFCKTLNFTNFHIFFDFPFSNNIVKLLGTLSGWRTIKY